MNMNMNMNPIYQMTPQKLQREMDPIEREPPAAKQAAGIYSLHYLEEVVLDFNPENKCKNYHHACALLFLKIVSNQIWIKIFITIFKSSFKFVIF